MTLLHKAEMPVCYWCENALCAYVKVGKSSVARIVPAAGRAVKGGEGLFSWHTGTATNCLHSFFPPKT